MTDKDKKFEEVPEDFEKDSEDFNEIPEDPANGDDNFEELSEDPGDSGHEESAFDEAHEEAFDEAPGQDPNESPEEVPDEPVEEMTEEIEEKKEPAKAYSRYRLDETPEERYDRKIMKRKKKRRSRNIFSGFVLVVIATLIIFVVGKYKKTQAPSVSQGTGNSTSGQAAQSSPDNNGNSDLAGSASNADASDESSNAGNTSDPSYLYEGTAMPNANTGDVVQDSKGDGKNHNKASSVYAYKVNDVKNAMYHGGELGGGKKIAFLTYDDGLNPESTPVLLDLLKKEGVPATFFSLGSTMVEKNKTSLERIFHEGHAIAFHSFDHSYKKLYPGRNGNSDEIVKQYNMSQQALNKLFGFEIPVSPWRYPGGHMSWKNLEAADKALEDLNVSWIDWNTMTADAEGKRAPKTVQGQVDHIINDWKAYGSPKVITILMHDVPTKKLTREALPEIIKTLKNEGFSFGILE